MNERPTPETDNQIFEAWDDEGHYIAWVVDADFARRLERQRDEALHDLRNLVPAILMRRGKGVMDMTAIDRLAELHESERQRDEWHGAFILATKRAGDAGELLVELKRQRDELLEELTVIRTIASYPHHPNALHAIQSISKNAIAAVKGGEG